MEYESLQVIAATSAMILFILLFIAALVYVARPENKDKFSHAAQAPLDKSERPEQ